MNKEILSARQTGKTLKSMINYIKTIQNNKIDNYVLYIKKEIWKQYKDELKDYLLNIKIIATDNLPENVNAIYMKEYGIR